MRVVSETQPLLPPTINNHVFQAVSEALFHDRLLDIEYHNAKQEQKRHGHAPLASLSKVIACIWCVALMAMPTSAV